MEDGFSEIGMEIGNTKCEWVCLITHLGE